MMNGPVEVIIWKWNQFDKQWFHDDDGDENGDDDVVDDDGDHVDGDDGYYYYFDVFVDVHEDDDGG